MASCCAVCGVLLRKPRSRADAKSLRSVQDKASRLRRVCPTRRGTAAPASKRPFDAMHRAHMTALVASVATAALFMLHVRRRRQHGTEAMLHHALCAVTAASRLTQAVREKFVKGSEIIKADMSPVTVLSLIHI